MAPWVKLCGDLASEPGQHRQLGRAEPLRGRQLRDAGCPVEHLQALSLWPPCQWALSLSRAGTRIF